MASSAEPITAALRRVQRGESGAESALWAAVYEDLKQLATGRLRQLGPGQTLQATALVHEAWMKLQGSADQGWDGRAHFFGAAARAMRNILVDQARRKQRLRRNSGVKAGELEADLVVDARGAAGDAVDMLALDEALTALGREYERPARIVMLRYFAGLGIQQIAEVLQIAPRTVDRDFLFARTWLRRHLEQA